MDLNLSMTEADINARTVDIPAVLDVGLPHPLVQIGHLANIQDMGSEEYEQKKHLPQISLYEADEPCDCGNTHAFLAVTFHSMTVEEAHRLKAAIETEMRKIIALRPLDPSRLN